MRHTGARTMGEDEAGLRARRFCQERRDGGLADRDLEVLRVGRLHNGDPGKRNFAFKHSERDPAQSKIQLGSPHILWKNDEHNEETVHDRVRAGG
jgi:hypothetical protein